MIGEISPSIIAFILGILFGTQLAHKITGRMAALVIIFSIVGALLFGAFTFTYSIYGGYIMPGLGLSMPLITATIGIIIGKLLKGE
ncbi:MAG: hypothetical protein NZ922_02585 [Candidatus Methanomethyliaceae archaeon]|nr:hypothetical protein [Candidatus Methanomethyliaceae archaeon]MDW7970916.1 hypothetical protein [Nitrososphaerota archaeon]